MIGTRCSSDGGMGEPKSFRGPRVYGQFKFGGLFDWKVG
jgi:hypothetical protein